MPAGGQQFFPTIQHRIDDKLEKPWMANAPDLKWLAVVLDGVPSSISEKPSARALSHLTPAWGRLVYVFR